MGKGATLLKVKLDDHLISERLIAIREAVPQATLIVDANEAGAAMARPSAVSYWRISAWRCWNSRFRLGPMKRWRILSTRCPFAPMRAVIRATARRRCAAAMRWSISNWIRPAV